MTSSNPDPHHGGPGGAPADAVKGTPNEKIKEDAKEVKHEVESRAREQAEAGQHRIADEADALSDAIDAAASSLDEHDRDGLARYARELSSNLANAAGQLEGRSIDELASDAKRLARNNPAMFMLGSIAVGFGLSRFFKASAEREHPDADISDRGDNKIRGDGMTTGRPPTPGGSDIAKAHTTSTAPRSGDGRDML